MAYLGGLPRESLFCLKKTWQCSLGLQHFIWTNNKTSGRMFFGQMRRDLQSRHVWLKCRAPRLIKTGWSTQTRHTVCQGLWWRGDDLVWFCSYRNWAHCSHRVNHELPCTAEYSRVKCEAICLTAKAWLKLGRATEQWFQAHQKIYIRMSDMLWQDL